MLYCIFFRIIYELNVVSFYKMDFLIIQTSKIDLITADAKIQSHKVFLPGEALEYEISGGGGTDFRPVFEFIDQEINYPTLLLYFTDGDGRFPDVEASYDVLWVMPEVKDVPFGEVVSLETN